MTAATAKLSNEDHSPINISHLSVGYGGPPIIEDISIDVRSGELFGLIGLNGAGKTTMIKTILGLREAQKGDISLFGHAPGKVGAKENLAYLPELFDPAWFLTGMEFLRFSLKLYDKKLPDSVFEDYARAVRLDPAALKRRVKSYSKGMRQKLGLLGTILTECPLLILDEPMSGLDPVARTLIKDMLLDVKKRGHTVFLSSHILADMDEICDRVAVLHDGQIRFTGEPGALKEQMKAESLERAFLALIEQ